MEGLKAWADDALGREPEVSAQPPAEEAPSIQPGAELVTVADMLTRDDLPPAVRAWLEMYAVQGEEWAEANNPPAWVADEGCWDRAKRAADHAGATDRWAFTAWWYIDHAGCSMK